MEKWATCGKKNPPLSRKDLIDKVGTRLLTVIVDFLPTATQPFETDLFNNSNFLR